LEALLVVLSRILGAVKEGMIWWVAMNCVLGEIVRTLEYPGLAVLRTHAVPQVLLVNLVDTHCIVVIDLLVFPEVADTLPGTELQTWHSSPLHVHQYALLQHKLGVKYAWANVDVRTHYVICSFQRGYWKENMDDIRGQSDSLSNQRVRKGKCAGRRITFSSKVPNSSNTCTISLM
jgi:hypothetical protein